MLPLIQIHLESNPRNLDALARSPARTQSRPIQSSILNVYCNAHVSGIALLTNIIATLCIACHRMQLVIAYVCV
ncbi:unnamed protein product [Cylicocyclus nassatus]|uniref:Uncharacterized protein n=1 Tax=Cylicocyclus nassatus TaxID=53992 RepID=A0AA36LYL1_CYLNA|nr:unnamed protein product [Cylicocyclus nassatus]